MDKMTGDLIGSVNNNEIKSNGGIRVVSIPNSEMEKLRITPIKKCVDVDMCTWVETDGKTSILNHGASPCLIVYARNTVDGRLISGHFPEFVQSRQDKFDLQRTNIGYLSYKDDRKGEGMVLPNQEQIDYLSNPRRDDGYGEFMKMKNRIKEWGVDNVEIYLFGNNRGAYGLTPEEYSQKVVESAIEQFGVSYDFYKLGIPYNKQFDHREAGKDKVDDTFYSASENVIKHSIRQFRDEGKYWIKNH